MEEVVYILGAGFSAPLGLPVMSNFRFKAQDLYFSNDQDFAYFKQVFNTIAKISAAMGYYETDVFNIEDILSILEMNDYLKGRKFRKQFKKFIIDVIRHYTPPIPEYQFKAANYPSNWFAHILPGASWGAHESWGHYARFAACLLGLKFYRNESHTIPLEQQITWDWQKERNVRYSVVTFNYDLVLENTCSYINTYIPYQLGPGNVSFGTSVDGPGCPLAKLQVHPGIPGNDRVG